MPTSLPTQRSIEMSLRAIKKRESQFQKHYYNKSTVRKPQGSLRKRNESVENLVQQQSSLGRKIHSCPELRNQGDDIAELRLLVRSVHLTRPKSDTDVNANTSSKNGATLAAAKSEFSLQTISVHNTLASYYSTSPTTSVLIKPQEMLSGARSHRDLSQSSYGTAVSSANGCSGSTRVQQQPCRRRMSECSLNSAYSQRTSAITGSALTLSNDESAAPIADGALRVPIVGYEVMEERARFTVYKLRVENPCSNDCWLVLRRYTDFVRLNAKLKQTFPHITLLLPRKKIFGDNFNAVFLDNRVQGLQMFVNSIMSKQEMRKCKIVREFFCLDEPPSYSESMEECRAIFEAQEETIEHLKLQIKSKNEAILNLQQRLQEEITEKEHLKQALKTPSGMFCAIPATNE